MDSRTRAGISLWLMFISVSALCRRKASVLNPSLQYKPELRLFLRAAVLCLAALFAANGQNALDEFTAAKTLLDQGQPVKAADRFREVVRMLDGTTDRLLISALNGLGVAYTRAGRFAEAESVLNRVLRICCKDAERLDPAWSVYLNNLAEVYRATGRWNDAERTYRRGLRISARSPEDEVRSALTANLGLLYHMQRKPGKAEPLLAEALAFFETEPDRNREKVVHLLSNLSGVHNALGRPALAREYCERALALAEQHLGRLHPSTAATLNNLAGLLQEAGELIRAERLYRRAVDIWTESAGAEHPNTGQALGNLATIAYRSGRHQEALEFYERALTILTKSYGADHPDTLRTSADLARLLRQTGQRARAAALDRTAKSLRERHERENLGAETVDVSDLLYRR